ncbi:MAG: SMC-Scp complex subunit ScpB [Gammaproteobacteria bacterium]|nr:SMC-Scp complex subunit ScpB [Gammaproteobacteria bacterium]
MNIPELKNIIEAALLASPSPLNIAALQTLFAEEQVPDKATLLKVIELLAEDYAGRGIEVKEVASGYRIQVRQQMAPWIARMQEERPVRYSRALLETLALIAYRQPITRAGIEEVRGVSVSTQIFKTLQEREWIRVVGHRDVPGKPALYGTTRQFLDYFNLKGLGDLPPLAEMRSIDTIQQEFDLKLGAALQGEGLPAPEDAADPFSEAAEQVAVASAQLAEDGAFSEDVALSEPVESQIGDVAGESEAAWAADHPDQFDPDATIDASVERQDELAPAV